MAETGKVIAIDIRDGGAHSDEASPKSERATIPEFAGVHPVSVREFGGHRTTTRSLAAILNYGGAKAGVFEAP
jgi:hypothetical protein